MAAETGSVCANCRPDARIYPRAVCMTIIQQFDEEILFYGQNTEKTTLLHIFLFFLSELLHFCFFYAIIMYPIPLWLIVKIVS